MVALVVCLYADVQGAWGRGGDGRRGEETAEEGRSEMAAETTGRRSADDALERPDRAQRATDAL